MPSDKTSPHEEAHIGEDLLASSSLSPLERKCFVVRQTVTDGDFTLEEALEAYGVTKAEFENYFAKQLVSEMRLFLQCSASNVFAITGSIAVISNIYDALLAQLDTESNVIQAHLKDLSTKIETGKVRV